MRTIRHGFLSKVLYIVTNDVRETAIYNEGRKRTRGLSSVLLTDEQNKRVKLMAYESEKIAELVAELEQLAKDTDATKLIIYAKKADIPTFTTFGYQQEGTIDGFYNGANAHMLCRYTTQERATSAEPQTADEIVTASLARQSTESVKAKELPTGYVLTEATEADAVELAQLYGIVFPVYPTPMNDPAYVKKTMQASTYYSVIRAEGKIVCAASAEVDPQFGSAEMTDCATHPDYLGKGLLQPVMIALEEKMEAMGIYFLYTLTRAQSAGMNITAAKQGYHYRGRLINNCTIVSGYEDMNIWVKPLRETHD
ncbi:putative beta-lysine N-acetyltransferase [Brevibacillus fluminis]|uniref:Putative beta-lysine N-acetyltransferase n=1 Tax=Brevibacillus fluminis TaxID=511487 RepID=A0A3M8DAA8_9BACL|nr:putative beta-lysine N-acetyltransferase [Brevibacillus fluminis]